MRSQDFRTAAAVLVIALTAAAPTLKAQDAAMADAISATPMLSQPCTSPLGALQPECQAAKNQITVSTANPLGEKGVLGAVSIPSARAPETEKATPTPALPTEPPSEFQRLVEASVGSALPVFGASLFESTPTTFAPLDRVPVTADYVIGPGDELLLRVWGQISLDAALTVDRSGNIFLPQAGAIRVAGLSYQELPGFLHSQMARVFRNFDLNVNMGQLRSIPIFVVGRCRRPGTYTVSSLSTLVNAVFASGGPNAQGSMRRIQVKRGGQLITEFDLYDLLLKGDKSQDTHLLPGDVVYIPPAGAQLAVAGSVRNPGIYEFRGEKTVGALIALAGGLSVLADSQRAVIERVRDRSYHESIDLQLDSKGMATEVRDGDVLRVLSVNPRFENVVTLRGNVANPGRFAWHQGMRLRDLIPDKEVLVTREYWRKRNLLGLAASQEAPLGAAHAPVAVETQTPDINWSYAVIERQKATDLSTELIPFHPGALLLENDPTENLELQRGDVVTIFSQADMQVATSQQRRLVRLEGEFNASGVYAVKPGEKLGDLIKRAGGLTPQAYLFGAEFVRESTRADQQRRLDQFIKEMEANVDRAATKHFGASDPNESSAQMAAQVEAQRSLIAELRAGKPTGRIVLSLTPGSNDISKVLDFPLEDGDRFTVPARPATVNVIGAVYTPNAFVFEPQLRIGDYLREAGGPTRDADRSRCFVVRADGSVLAKQESRSFDSETLNAGDSVVMPEAVFRTSFMFGLREWSQVLSSFGLAAAAINVLR